MKSWKGMPCKDCLIKKKCKEHCFEIPDEDLAQYYTLRDQKNKNEKCVLCDGVLKINSSKYLIQYKCNECTFASYATPYQKRKGD